MNSPKADLGAILGTALFGVVSDLTEAKEKGQQLPGVLDDVASIALDAKQKGINLAKEEAKYQAIKYLPWFVAGVCLIIILYLLSKR